MPGPQLVQVRARLRVEAGPRGLVGDRVAGLWDDADDASWDASLRWRPAALDEFFVRLRTASHVLADLEHLLLETCVEVRPDGAVRVTSELVLEGHPFGRVGERLAQNPSRGPMGTAARGTGRMLDRVVKQSHEVLDIYGDPVQRRAFAHAVRHPDLLTPNMQRTLLYLVLVSSVWLWFVVLTGLALAAPGLAVAWNVLCGLYFAALGTNLFLPIPLEPLALAARGTVGTWPAAAASGAGKMVGAWIIFSLGPFLRAGVGRLEAGSPTMRRVMARAERFARRFGSVALGALLAVPFSPFDIVPVYLFSTLGLRLRPFLAAVFLGFGARILAVLLLGDLLFGPGP